MNPSDLLAKSLTIISNELSKLQELSTNTKDSLGKDCADIVNNYVLALTRLKEDERKDVKIDAVESKSDEELNKLAAEALKYLEGNGQAVQLNQDGTRRKKADPNRKKIPGKLRCGRCEKYLPLVNFHKNKANPTGYSNRCKNCVRISRKKTAARAVEVKESE